MSIYHEKFQSLPITCLAETLNICKTNNMKISEVGVWDGSTTNYYADIIKECNGHIYAIDWFKGNKDATGMHSYNEENEENIVNKFKSNTKKYQDIITILKGVSYEMIEQLPSDMDFIFIDAAHNYTNVYKDIQAAIKKIKPGGFIAGHDCENLTLANTFKPEWLELDCVNNIHCGVIQAVYDIFGNTVTLIPDSITKSNIWIKKL